MSFARAAETERKALAVRSCERALNMVCLR